MASNVRPDAEGAVRVTVLLEYRFCATPDRRLWAKEAFAFPFWRRYLATFDAVRIVARAEPVAEPAPGWTRSDGDGVEAFPLPAVRGALGHLRGYRALRSAIAAALATDDAVILRVPGFVSMHAAHAIRGGRPYGVEVLGDPADVFAPGVVRHPLRPLLRVTESRRLRRTCAAACAAAYVTERSLQRRYPPGAGAMTTAYSSVELGADAFAAPRSPTLPAVPTAALIGSMEQPYKGVDTAIAALALLRANGRAMRLAIVGDGACRPGYERQAAELGVADAVVFHGRLAAGPEVRAVLDGSDLYLQPSRTEGLPRALIEAMARGLPCIASRVGGIPELLDDAELVPAGDAAALAAAIGSLLDDAHRRRRLSERNLLVAGRYRDDLLAARRRSFYAAVRHATERWMAAGREAGRVRLRRAG